MCFALALLSARAQVDLLQSHCPVVVLIVLGVLAVCGAVVFVVCVARGLCVACLVFDDVAYLPPAPRPDCLAVVGASLYDNVLAVYSRNVEHLRRLVGALGPSCFRWLVRRQYLGPRDGYLCVFGFCARVL